MSGEDISALVKIENTQCGIEQCIEPFFCSYFWDGCCHWTEFEGKTMKKVIEDLKEALRGFYYIGFSSEDEHGIYDKSVDRVERVIAKLEKLEKRQRNEKGD
jgi:hypothetical protein